MNQSQVSKDVSYKEVIKMAKSSFKTEIDRQESLYKIRQDLFGVYAVLFLLSAFVDVCRYISCGEFNLYYCSYFIIAFLPYLPMFNRYKYETMITGEEILHHIETNIDDYNDTNDYIWQYIQQLSTVQKSKKLVNNKLSSTVKVCVIAIYADIIYIFIFGILMQFII